MTFTGPGCPLHQRGRGKRRRRGSLAIGSKAGPGLAMPPVSDPSRILCASRGHLFRFYDCRILLPVKPSRLLKTVQSLWRLIMSFRINELFGAAARSLLATRRQARGGVRESCAGAGVTIKAAFFDSRRHVILAASQTPLKGGIRTHGWLAPPRIGAPA